MKVEVKFDLKSALKAKGITATELSQRTGIRAGTLSEMQRRKSLNLPHLSTIMTELGITDIRELMKVEIVLEERKVSSL